MNLEQEILDYIYEYDKTCGDNYGNNNIAIAEGLNKKPDEIKDALSKLFKDKRIIIRKSPFGPLIFLNYGLYGN